MFFKSIYDYKLPRPPKKTPETHAVLIKDPAIEKWGKMRETTHLHFKMTPKTVSLGIFWGLVVPGIMYYTLKRSLQQQDIKNGKEPRDFL